MSESLWARIAPRATPTKRSGSLVPRTPPDAEVGQAAKERRKLLDMQRRPGSFEEDKQQLEDWLEATVKRVA